MNIYLIRHGRQNSRLCNVNVELAPEGFKQADLLGQRLAYANIEKVYSSDLLRAVQTAQTANLYWQADHQIRPELREISFGDLEGLTEEVIAEKYADFNREKEMLEEDLPYPGGENGADVCKRIRPAIEEIVSGAEKNVAVVTHGGVIRSFISEILHMPLAKKLLLASALENCSITKVHYERERERFYLDGFNDWAHLEKYPELQRKNWLI